MNTFSTETIIPKPVEEIFEFFSKAENLGLLTPDFLKFKILTTLPIEMKQGTLIDYKLRIHGIPIKWKTKISKWEPPLMFTDEQLRGPYKTWIHTHSFSPINNGHATCMKDHVRYDIFGKSLIGSFVRKDIQKIFDYRNQKITDIFTNNNHLSNNTNNHPTSYEKYTHCIS